MGLELVGTANDLAVHRVLEAVFNSDDDGLIHLVADDQTFAHLAVCAIDAVFTHAAPPS